MNKSKKIAKSIRYVELEVGDLLFDDAGEMYTVVYFMEPKYSTNHGTTIVGHFRIDGVWNTNYSAGNALADEEVRGFDHQTWVWHSRLGCLLT